MKKIILYLSLTFSVSSFANTLAGTYYCEVKSSEVFNTKFMVQLNNTSASFVVNKTNIVDISESSTAVCNIFANNCDYTEGKMLNISLIHSSVNIETVQLFVMAIEREGKKIKNWAFFFEPLNNKTNYYGYRFTQKEAAISIQDVDEHASVSCIKE